MGSRDDYYDEKWRTIKLVCNQCGTEYECSANDVAEHNCIPVLIERIKKLEQLTDALLKAVRFIGGPI